MFYMSPLKKKTNGIGKSMEAQVQCKPGHLVSDMIGKK